MNLTRGCALLVISDAAAQIANSGCEGHLRSRRLVNAWPWNHIADLGYFTFRLLVCGVEFGAIRFAGGVLEGPDVHTKDLLTIRVASGDGLTVADILAKYIEVLIQESAFSLVEHIERFGLVRFHGG